LLASRPQMHNKMSREQGTLLHLLCDICEEVGGGHGLIYHQYRKFKRNWRIRNGDREW
jgi:hypothetical protein